MSWEQVHEMIILRGISQTMDWMMKQRMMEMWNKFKYHLIRGLVIAFLYCVLFGSLMYLFDYLQWFGQRDMQAAFVNIFSTVGATFWFMIIEFPDDKLKPTEPTSKPEESQQKVIIGEWLFREPGLTYPVDDLFKILKTQPDIISAIKLDPKIEISLISDRDFILDTIAQNQALYQRLIEFFTEWENESKNKLGILK